MVRCHNWIIYGAKFKNERLKNEIHPTLIYHHVPEFDHVGFKHIDLTKRQTNPTPSQTKRYPITIKGWGFFNGRRI